MKENRIIHFVSFETTLDSEAFFIQWEKYKQSTNTDWQATLQQHILKNGKFKYISQHRCPSNEFQFVFKKEKHSFLFIPGNVADCFWNLYRPVSPFQ